MLPDAVTVTEVVLRDGLQDEPTAVATADKLRLLDGLLDAGVRSVEIGAFVRADRVPQMADSDELFALAPPRPGVTYSALVLNARGAVRAVAAEVPEARLVVSASEGHSRANSGHGVDLVLDSLDQAAEILVGATPRPALVGAIATAFVCPFDGPTPTAAVVRIARRLVAAGAERISLADTLGAANPAQVRAAVLAVREAMPEVPLGLHLHDTYGMALACAWEALQLGVRDFDTALGGIGGCPFAPGAAGNAATEDLVGLLHGAGIETGIDLDRLLDLVPLVADMVGHGVDSHQSRARSARAQAPH